LYVAVNESSNDAIFAGTEKLKYMRIRQCTLLHVCKKKYSSTSYLTVPYLWIYLK
jgi:hypothetical protein